MAFLLAGALLAGTAIVANRHAFPQHPHFRHDQPDAPDRGHIPIRGNDALWPPGEVAAENPWRTSFKSALPFPRTVDHVHMVNEDYQHKRRQKVFLNLTRPDAPYVSDTQKVRFAPV